MKNCCICGNPITDNQPAILFIGVKGDEKEICLNCKDNIDAMTIIDDSAKVKDSINYLYNCLLSIKDTEVAAVLKDGINANALIVENLNQDKAVKRDYFLDNKFRDYNVWISILQAIAWIFFVSIISFGIFIAYEVGGSEGFITLLIMVFSAFLSLALIMVFINIAKDISDIKKNRK